MVCCTLARWMMFVGCVEEKATPVILLLALLQAERPKVLDFYSSQLLHLFVHKHTLILYCFAFISEYITFLILPVNASLVHINNWNPVFTHMGRFWNSFYIINVLYTLKYSMCACIHNPQFCFCVAVLVNDKYVVAGEGDIALNTTHPSPLEENHMIYNLYLTPEFLPHTEELILSGPISDKIHIQVGGDSSLDLWTIASSLSVCLFSMWGL